MYKIKNDRTDFSRLLGDMSDVSFGANNIDPDLYNQYNVKRGLRNADNTGVLVGLTNVGDVRAYIMEENEKIPIPGKLIYRGINVYDFVDGYQKNNRFGFEECVYLLLTGNLPSKQQLEEFTKLLEESRQLPDGFTEDMIMKAPSPDIMNKLARCVLASYSYDDNADDLAYQNVMKQCIKLIAQFPAMVAYAYQAKSHYYGGKSLYLHNSEPGLSTSELFFHLTRPDCKYTKLEAEILDLNMVLHAEHGGGNNSSFTARVVSSTGTDTYSAIAAAIGSLKGPKHGGANLKVMEMMEDVKRNISDWSDDKEIYDYLVKILNRDAYDNSGLIYGIGHAVYTVSDPRAVLLKQKAEELADATGSLKEYKLYTKMEELAPEAFSKVKNNNKAMCANVDFYSGFVYSMLNIPKELYTPIFAISRIAGWSAHRLEEIAGGSKIIRPAYKNVGAKVKYEDLGDR